jgi:hypothetical protein
MRKLLPFLKWFLLIWGGLSLVGAIGIGGFFAYQLGPGNIDKIDSASNKDVRFVLNWCELGDERIEKVIHSHISSRSFTGDHLDAYAIQISHVSIAELTAKKEDFHGRWYRGDEVSGVLDDAVDFLAGWLNSGEIPWFPSEEELRSDGYFVYPRSIYCHGVRPIAAQLIFVRSTDKMIFYFSGKT